MNENGNEYESTNSENSGLMYEQNLAQLWRLEYCARLIQKNFRIRHPELEPTIRFKDEDEIYWDGESCPVEEVTEKGWSNIYTQAFIAIFSLYMMGKSCAWACLQKCLPKKDDDVVVTAGRNKGKSGKVVKVLRDKNRVIVAGVNMVRRHTKPSASSAGGIVEKESSINLSNVSYADPKDGKPTRIGYKTLEDGRKVRFAKRSGELIDR